jgi:hypothetical protein
MSVEIQTVQPRWEGLVFVAAPGPSLTEDVAERIIGQRVVAIQDAYRRVPFAAVLYGCNVSWWNYHKGCPVFAGEKWSSHGAPDHNNKMTVAQRYGVNLVRGSKGEGFSLDPSLIHYGRNSGFQGVNLTIHLTRNPVIALVGFNMQKVDGNTHFFGEHPRELNQGPLREFIGFFNHAARQLPPHIKIVNCTPNSALQCFPFATLDDLI